ncbi:hypothetical protein [Flavobacterium sp. HJJ]|uniref:hypothetical protein n=1 Tax=Flavobacterium sp. HJJ TaxID=2783792 RepID=UPI00188B5F53|nr:hypothetical protein [Flavobacterium sp. HJJ]MBF4471887.1 hypothetical protein [Flavobacterium sp. HJJ]
MIHKSLVKKGFELVFVLITIVYFDFSLHAQNQLDEKFKEKAGNKWYNMVYQAPNSYYGIEVESCYNGNENFIQSAFDHGIKSKTHDIVVAFAMIYIMADDTPRGKRIREVFGNPTKINLEAIAYEADTTWYKVKYLDSLQLKKISADRGIIYNMKITKKYKGIYDRCKKIIEYKDNVGRAEILFFYNKGDDALVDEEIKNTWGMLKFKS